MIATKLKNLVQAKTPVGWLATCAIYGLAITWLYPFAWMVLASLKPTAEVYNTNLFEGHLSPDNYVFLFGSAEKLHRPFLGALGISFFVALTVTVSVLITSAFIGYALARITFSFRDKFRDFLLLLFRKCGGGRDIECQCHLRADFVYILTAGPTAAGSGEADFGFGN